MKHNKSDHSWSGFHTASKWVLLSGFIACSVISVFSLRQNNLTAIELRDKVFVADKENKDVESALQDLRQFVYSHMNSDLSSGGGVQYPIQLKYRYERLLAKEKSRVEKANSAIYTDAQKYCEAKLPGSVSGGPRVACIEEYVLQKGEKPREIPEDLYKFDFLSPQWSPDLAGWSMIGAGIFLVAFIVKVLLDRLLKSELEV